MTDLVKRLRFGWLSHLFHDHQWGQWLGERGRDALTGDFWGYRERACRFCPKKQKERTKSVHVFDGWISETKGRGGFQ